jgi:hypothetical protein
MKLFAAIVGLLFAGFGVYTTFQAWSYASAGHRMDSLAYVGPFLIVMGLFRVARSLGGFPPNLLLRYVFLGIAIGIGVADGAVIKTVYPNAVPLASSTNR